MESPLPEDYKNFIMFNNGMVPSKNLFNVNKAQYLIERFLCILENTKDNPLGMYDIDVVVTQLDERIFFHEDVKGYELIPIAALFGGTSYA